MRNITKRLKKKNVSDIMSLTPLQSGMLYHYLKNPGSHLHFEQLSIDIRGEIDKQYFEQAWNEVVNTNEMLRTCFRWRKVEEPFQVVLKIRKIQPLYHDLSVIPHQDKKKYLENIKAQDRNNTFNLEEVPFRIILCRLTKTKSIMIISNHHILYDGWSNGIILSEFFNAYTCLTKGIPHAPVNKTTFGEYIKRLQRQNREDKTKAFWTDYLKEIDTITELPLKEKKKNEEEKDIKTHTLLLNASLTNRIDCFAKDKHMTPAVLIYSAWGILLQKYNNTDDVLFGTTASNRSVDVKGIEDIVGLFINTLPMRVKTEPGEKCRDLLQQLNHQLQQRNKYQSSSLVEIKTYANMVENEELFDTLVVIENYPLDSRLRDTGQQQLKVDSYEINETSPYDLTLVINALEEIKIEFLYNKNAINENTVTTLALHFQKILVTIIKNTETPVMEIEIILESERRKVLTEFNSPAGGYVENKTLYHLFREQVERTPDAVALAANVTLSYRRLNQKASDIAAILTKKGIRPGDIVALSMDRSIGLSTAILAIMKAGAVYMPINPKNPAHRTAFLMKDSNAALLLTAKQLEKMEKETEITVPSAAIFSPTHSPAYIIYTSGSTGEPKGVSITHRNICPLLHWGYKNVKIGGGDRVIQNVPIYFDWSIWEIFITLTSGAAMYPTSEEVLLNPDAIIDFIETNRITTLHVTPTQYRYQLNTGRKSNTLRHLLIGGEKMTAHLVENSFKCIDKKCRVYNMYGPTEVTIISTVQEIKHEELQKYKELSSVPIGIPIANGHLYILDRYKKICPIDVVGELYISGAGVAEGYLNNPEFTAEKFIAPPSSLNETDGLLYKTGDYTRWLPDGTVEFMGRIDHQVKIRGLRIELGEIEKNLLAHPGVKEVVVIDKKIGGDTYICAYIMGDRTKALTGAELKEHLAKRLPAYMLPSYFMQLENLPLNPNGKVDRDALPEPEITTGSEYMAPGTALEKTLEEIWRTVLKTNKPIGIDDNFFDCGGHSINAMLLTSKIHKACNADIQLKSLFLAPTIRQLAATINEMRKETYYEVKPVEKKEYYPLSSAQKRLYVLTEMMGKSTGYNITEVVKMNGRLDKDKLERALSAVIARHESLRTSFNKVDDIPVQRVHGSVEFHMEFYRLTGKDGKITKNIEELKRNFVRPFDLTDAPLFRVGLIESASREYLLMVDMHHIVSDMVSMEVFIRDITAHYKGEEFSELRLQYKDYTRWSYARRRMDIIQRQGRYWREQFTGEIPVLSLPTDQARPAKQRFEGSRMELELSTEETAELKQRARENEATDFMLLLAAAGIFLSKIGGREDIVVGTPVTGRNHSDLEQIIGMFVNTLPIRTNPSGDKSFVQYLTEVRSIVLDALENQEYTYEDMVETLVPERDPSRNPLFDTAFAFLEKHTAKKLRLELPELKIIPQKFETTTSKFDLTIYGYEVDGQYQFQVEYSTVLFNKETINGFIGVFRRVLSIVAEGQNTGIGEFEIIPELEKRRVLTEFNSPSNEYAEDKTLDRLFEEQVERTPDAVAAVEKDIVTYRRLNEKAAIIAAKLQEKGVRPGNIVALSMERSTGMLATIQGILKAGAVYMPINPKNPGHRLDYLMKDSNAALLVTTNLLDRMENDPKPTIPADRTISPPHSTAYIIYTSGSTGEPKGVPITHRNICPLLHWGYRNLELGVGDRVIQNLPVYFDWSVWEIFITLTTGAALYPTTEEILLNPNAIIDFMETNRITTLHITPTQYRYQVNTGRKNNSLRNLFIGAEKLTTDLVETSIKYINKNCRIYNMYGPTEATIISAVQEIKREELQNYKRLTSVPIGMPVGNGGIYILDKYKQLCPINIVGELYLSGTGVANGYLNNPELSSEKFIVPASPLNEVEGYLYKTGDHARWLPDGSVEFLARIDHQVKIRGLRIELGEIENHLLTHPGIKESVVIDRELNGDIYICAYIVADTRQSVPTAELKRHLAERLPGYMLPSYFVPMENIPLNANGKVDRNALPEPENNSTAHRLKAPRKELERKLVEIWAEELNRDTGTVGVDEDFFQVGGHSLKAVRVTSRIHKELEVKMTLQEFFEAGTVEELACRIEDAGKEKIMAVDCTEKREYYPLSPAQNRLYFLNRMEGIKTAYNLPVVMEIMGNPDKHRFQSALGRMVLRHESLRTTFPEIDGKPVQYIHDEVEMQMQYSRCNEDEIQREIDTFIRPFDLHKAPLLRAALLEITPQKHILLFDMHHIISDGASMVNQVREFIAHYEDKKLPSLNIQYRDFSQWQHRTEGSPRQKKQERYWLNRLKGRLPLLELPLDHQRPPIQTFTGNSIIRVLEGDLKTRLEQVAQEADATLYMLQLAAFCILLSKYAAQRDIIVGIPSAGRSHPDQENMIGLFVNTLPFRCRPDNRQNLREFIRKVRDDVLNDTEHQEFPVDRLINQLDIPRELNRNPLFDVLFVSENFDFPALAVENLSFRAFPYENKIAHLDIVFYMHREGETDRIRMELEYTTALFEKETIERMQDHYMEVLEQVARLWDEADVQLKDIIISHTLTAPDSQAFIENQVDFDF
jgi:amino acid adenylation domain-containing protein